MGKKTYKNYIYIALKIVKKYNYKLLSILLRPHCERPMRNTKEEAEENKTKIRKCDTDTENKMGKQMWNARE